ncbi:MAG: amidohydrolase family protein [Planctomycetota bacterium]
MRIWTARACWLLDGHAPPRRNVRLTVAGCRLAGVEPHDGGRVDVDYGDCVVAPGFVNAHTHLEFGGLTGPTPPLETPVPFAEWLRELIAARRAAAGERTAESLISERRAGVIAALDELVRSGVTTVGEIARPDWPDQTIGGQPETLVFLELLGLARARVEPLLSLATAHLDRAAVPLISYSHIAPSQSDLSQSGVSECVVSESGGANRHSLSIDGAIWPNLWRAGLSPHAPYTVHPELLVGACRLSSERQVPLAMHLAESFEELELLRSHSGGLVETLREFDAWDPTALPRGSTPGDYLRQLATAWRAVVVHGNFLDAADWTFLGEARERMSVAYCPRTHARFVSTPYPLTEMLAAGVRVVLGTDSRATNPDLDFLTELRWVALRYPDLDRIRLLRMATADAAYALGLDDRGWLSAGKRADFVVLRAATGCRTNPWEWLDDTSWTIAGVCLRGELGQVEQKNDIFGSCPR